jgi:hypothetical protein
MIQLHTLLRKSERKIEYCQYHRKGEYFYNFFITSQQRFIYKTLLVTSHNGGYYALMQWAIAKAELILQLSKKKIIDNKLKLFYNVFFNNFKKLGIKTKVKKKADASWKNFKLI